MKETLKKNKVPILLFGASILILAGLVVGGAYAMREIYKDRVFPNVSVNGIEVGGLTQAQALEKINAQYEKMLAQGLRVSLGSESKTINLQSIGATDPDLIYDLLVYNSEAAASQAYETGRNRSYVVNLFTPVFLIVGFIDYTNEVTILEDQLATQIRAAFPDAESPGEPTDFIAGREGGELVISVQEGFEGEVIDVEGAFESIKHDARDLSLAPLELSLMRTTDVVPHDAAQDLIPLVFEAIEAAPYTLTYTTQGQREFTWNITQNQLLDWLHAAHDKKSGYRLALGGENFETFIADLRRDVDIAPQDARFRMEGGRVVEFKASLDGIMLDADETFEKLLEKLGEQNTKIDLAVAVDRPDVPTEDVNDLGIKEILGVGISNFSGSPSNRIRNIQHGAAKLNGLLIAPGQTVSLVKELGPFTVADGYLPELVIKGDEIIPEVGGGLCQIGTTTFRATMNAGLEVTERRNHSLVVSYYNDPSNGNPGTDATIYDPSPDYKFTNDTAHHILLTTEVDLRRGELIFTFWGTSDGRKGSYTPPKILSWNGYGATKYIETTDLAPGVTRCQSPHPGATTSFDYMVEYADGTVFTKNYTSQYRSLPRICLVGVASGGGTGGGGDELTVDDIPADDISAPEVPIE